MSKGLIYVVEDEENIRDLIYYTLSAAGFEARVFPRSEEFWDALREKPPSLVLLDVMLPGENGYDILKKLRLTPGGDTIPVIYITAKSAELDKVHGLDGGADDYITKPFKMLEFISRVNAVLRRYKMTQPINGEDIGYKDLKIKKLSREIFKSGKPLSLTYKEYELFMSLYENMGTVLSRDSLLSRVWGFDYEGGTRTVDMHIKSLRQKIGDSADTPKYIKTVRGYGYVLMREETRL